MIEASVGPRETHWHISLWTESGKIKVVCGCSWSREEEVPKGAEAQARQISRLRWMWIVHRCAGRPWVP